MRLDLFFFFILYVSFIPITSAEDLWPASPDFNGVQRQALGISWHVPWRLERFCLFLLLFSLSALRMGI
jgi:hypothetical protein